MCDQSSPCPLPAVVRLCALWFDSAWGWGWSQPGAGAKCEYWCCTVAHLLTWCQPLIKTTAQVSSWGSCLMFVCFCFLIYKGRKIKMWPKMLSSKAVFTKIWHTRLMQMECFFIQYRLVYHSLPFKDTSLIETPKYLLNSNVSSAATSSKLSWNISTWCWHIPNHNLRRIYESTCSRLCSINNAI